MQTILPATADHVHQESSPAFAATRDRFDRIVGWLEGVEASQLAHNELEERLELEGRELLRQMLQDHLDLRAQREPRLDLVVGADGVARRGIEASHERGLLTVFGKVEVTRLPSRRRGHANLHPADADLNLPVELHSHGLRRLLVLEATRGSFDDVREAIRRSTGQRLGKRQLEELVQRAAIDFDGFYEGRRPTGGASEDVLVISCDGKRRRHASGRPARRHRSGRGSEHDQAGHPALEGGEAQPQAHGRKCQSGQRGSRVLRGRPAAHSPGLRRQQ